MGCKIGFGALEHFGMQHPILRVLFGKFVSVLLRIGKSNILFLATNPELKCVSRVLGKPTESVIQDIVIPIYHAADFLNFLTNRLGSALSGFVLINRWGNIHFAN